MVYLPHPPTHPPPKSNFLPRRYRLRGVWWLIFYNETWWEEVFIFYPGTINLCFDQTWQGPRWEKLQFNHWVKFGVPMFFFFFVFWALEETYYHPRLLFGQEFPIFQWGCFLDLICIPIYVSFSNNQKKRVIFLPSYPPKKIRITKRGTHFGGIKQAAHIW